jgi:hypothetical protein
MFCSFWDGFVELAGENSPTAQSARSDITSSATIILKHPMHPEERLRDFERPITNQPLLRHELPQPQLEQRGNKLSCDKSYCHSPSLSRCADYGGGYGFSAVTPTRCPSFLRIKTLGPTRWHVGNNLTLCVQRLYGPQVVQGTFEISAV